MKNISPMILKIVVGILVLAVIVVVWRGYNLTQEKKSSIVQENFSDKDIVDIHMRSLKDKWYFEPNEITISVGVVTRLRIFNEDSFNHGFEIEELSIDKVLLPLQETTIDIFPQSSGEYTFSCSVFCGIGHFEQKGKLIVK